MDMDSIPAGRSAVRQIETSFHVIGDYEAVVYQALGRSATNTLHAHGCQAHYAGRDTPDAQRRLTDFTCPFTRGLDRTSRACCSLETAFGTLSAWLMPWLMAFWHAR